MVEILILALSFLILWFIHEHIQSRKRPPGPTRFPLVGTLYALIKNGGRELPPFKVLQRLAKVYGPVMSLRTGLVDQVVITDFELMKEILSSDVWIDRYFDKYIMERSNGRHLGIIFISGDVWKEMRRFTTRTLRDFGFGRQLSQEGVIASELNDLKSRLNEILKNPTEGGAVGLKQFFTISVLNILWSMIAGQRFSHDNERLQELISLIDEMSKAFPITASIMTAYPFLRHIIPRFTETGRKRLMFRGKIHKFFRSLLEERRRLGVYKKVQKDFIDVFLNEIDNNKSKNALGEDFYSDEQFILVTLDLFLAGSETTSNTLEFAFLYMILHPEVQKSVQEEVDRVVGRDRCPASSDRQEMPYTEATLLEVQRLANVIPMIVRSPNQNTKIGSYDIPKGTLGVFNTYAWHLNEKHWPDPMTFDPKRFLDENGRVINAHKILPFGLGKRVCLGEVLAKATIFSYFTAMLQSYNFEQSPDHPKPTMDPDFGFTLSPHSYYAKITPR